jgi:hypothetical protein
MISYWLSKHHAGNITDPAALTEFFHRLWAREHDPARFARPGPKKWKRAGRKRQKCPVPRV